MLVPQAVGGEFNEKSEVLSFLLSVNTLTSLYKGGHLCALQVEGDQDKLCVGLLL